MKVEISDAPLNLYNYGHGRYHHSVYLVYAPFAACEISVVCGVLVASFCVCCVCCVFEAGAFYDSVRYSNIHIPGRSRGGS